MKFGPPRKPPYDPHQSTLKRMKSKGQKPIQSRDDLLRGVTCVPINSIPSTTHLNPQERVDKTDGETESVTVDLQHEDDDSTSTLSTIRRRVELLKRSKGQCLIIDSRLSSKDAMLHVMYLPRNRMFKYWKNLWLARSMYRFHLLKASFTKLQVYCFVSSRTRSKRNFTITSPTRQWVADEHHSKHLSRDMDNQSDVSSLCSESVAMVTHSTQASNTKGIPRRRRLSGGSRDRPLSLLWHNHHTDDMTIDSGDITLSQTSSHTNMDDASESTTSSHMRMVSMYSRGTGPHMSLLVNHGNILPSQSKHPHEQAYHTQSFDDEPPPPPPAVVPLISYKVKPTEPYNHLSNYDLDERHEIGMLSRFFCKWYKRCAMFSTCKLMAADHYMKTRAPYVFSKLKWQVQQSLGNQTACQYFDWVTSLSGLVWLKHQVYHQRTLREWLHHQHSMAYVFYMRYRLCDLFARVGRRSGSLSWLRQICRRADQHYLNRTLRRGWLVLLSLLHRDTNGTRKQTRRWGKQEVETRVAHGGSKDSMLKSRSRDMTLSFNAADNFRIHYSMHVYLYQWRCHFSRQCVLYDDMWRAVQHVRCVATSRCLREWSQNCISHRVMRHAYMMATQRHMYTSLAKALGNLKRLLKHRRIRRARAGLHTGISSRFSRSTGLSVSPTEPLASSHVPSTTSSSTKYPVNSRFRSNKHIKVPSSSTMSTLFPIVPAQGCSSSSTGSSGVAENSHGASHHRPLGVFSTSKIEAIKQSNGSQTLRKRQNSLSTSVSSITIADSDPVMNMLHLKHALSRWTERHSNLNQSLRIQQSADTYHNMWLARWGLVAWYMCVTVRRRRKRGQDQSSEDGASHSYETSSRSRRDRNLNSNFDAEVSLVVKRRLWTSWMKHINIAFGQADSISYGDEHWVMARCRKVFDTLQGNARKQQAKRKRLEMRRQSILRNTISKTSDLVGMRQRRGSSINGTRSLSASTSQDRKVEESSRLHELSLQVQSRRSESLLYFCMRAWFLATMTSQHYYSKSLWKGLLAYFRFLTRVAVARQLYSLGASFRDAKVQKQAMVQFKKLLLSKNIPQQIDATASLEGQTEEIYTSSLGSMSGRPPLGVARQRHLMGGRSRMYDDI